MKIMGTHQTDYIENIRKHRMQTLRCGWRGKVAATIDCDDCYMFSSVSSWFHRKRRNLCTLYQSNQVQRNPFKNVSTFFFLSLCTIHLSSWMESKWDEQLDVSYMCHMYLLANAYGNLNPEYKCFSFNFKWKL